MRQPLHRKKLQLALQALGSDADPKGKLDHNWATSECCHTAVVLQISFNAWFNPPMLLQGGWMTSASRSTRATLMRLVWTDACCTT